ncbi:hypothetical protein GCM10010913_42420 [Paenibacillus aceti]|uniref:Uncharacterized protein n=1 Tax=Paenibacillus aceti TaxID=1820010 RepID=A0ABQ1W5S8_9BACL|nr:hypothetical protein GCM10010913_42420 [Paenibacillus aceti]
MMLTVNIAIAKSDITIDNLDLMDKNLLTSWHDVEVSVEIWLPYYSHHNRIVRFCKDVEIPISFTYN